MESSSITRPEESNPEDARLPSESSEEAVNSARPKDAEKDAWEKKRRTKGEEETEKIEELSKYTQKRHKPGYAVITVATGESEV